MSRNFIVYSFPFVDEFACSKESLLYSTTPEVAVQKVQRCRVEWISWEPWCHAAQNSTSTNDLQESLSASIPCSVTAELHGALFSLCINETDRKCKCSSSSTSRASHMNSSQQHWMNILMENCRAQTRGSCSLRAIVFHSELEKWYAVRVLPETAVQKAHSQWMLSNLLSIHWLCPLELQCREAHARTCYVSCCRWANCPCYLLKIPFEMICSSCLEQNT